MSKIPNEYFLKTFLKNHVPVYTNALESCGRFESTPLTPTETVGPDGAVGNQDKSRSARLGKQLSRVKILLFTGNFFPTDRMQEA